MNKITRVNWDTAHKIRGKLHLKVGRKIVHLYYAPTGKYFNFRVTPKFLEVYNNYVFRENGSVKEETILINFIIKEKQKL